MGAKSEVNSSTYAATQYRVEYICIMVEPALKGRGDIIRLLSKLHYTMQYTKVLKTTVFYG